MIQERQTAPLALRLITAPILLLGAWYIFIPILALRPDVFLAAHPDSKLGWVLMLIHPILGVAMIYTSILVWRHFTTRVLYWFWIYIGAACLVLPEGIGLIMHYGK